MLRPFAHPVACCWMLLRVVAQSLKPVKLLAPCKRTQHCWLTTPNMRLFARSLTLESGFKKMFSFGLNDFVWKSRFVQKYMQFKNIRMRVDVAQVYGILQVWMILRRNLIPLCRFIGRDLFDELYHQRARLLNTLANCCLFVKSARIFLIPS